MVRARELVDGQYVEDGIWEAHGDVRAFASGAAEVRAYDRSRIWASGRVHLFCADQARAMVADTSSGSVHDRGTVTLLDRSSMGLSGEAPRAIVHGWSRVWMNDGARVDASGHATIVFVTGTTGVRMRILLRDRSQIDGRIPRHARVRRMAR